MRAIDYALDLHSPVLHVALAIEAAEAASISDLTASYSHPIPSDLERVMRAEKCSTKAEAVHAIMAEVITQLQRRGKEGAAQLVESDGKWRFADGVTFESLRWRGAAIKRPAPDIHARLHDPFNPNTGAWSENIRDFSKGKELDELRESMREFGWLPELPAIADERGVVIIGHRRITVAKELGIEPVIRKIEFGAGDAADARRARLAIASNLGGKPLSMKDREKIAAFLYIDLEWSVLAVAKALNVTDKTINIGLKNQGILLVPHKNTRGYYSGKLGHPNRHLVIEEIENNSPLSTAELAQKYEMESSTVLRIKRGRKEPPSSLPPFRPATKAELEARGFSPTSYRHIIPETGETISHVEALKRKAVTEAVEARADLPRNCGLPNERRAAQVLDALAVELKDDPRIVGVLMAAKQAILDGEARLAIAAQAVTNEGTET